MNSRRDLRAVYSGVGQFCLVNPFIAHAPDYALITSMRTPDYFRPFAAGVASLLAAAATTQVAAQSTPPTPTQASPAKGSRPSTAALSRPNQPDFKRATVAEFDELRARPDAVVLDVRTHEEFNAGHIPKAGLLDIKSPDFMQSLGSLDRSKLYLVNCAVGGRSSRACQNLAALGFTNVVNLEGGFKAWEKVNASTISKDPPTELPKAKVPSPRENSATPKQRPAFKSPATVRQTPSK